MGCDCARGRLCASGGHLGLQWAEVTGAPIRPKRRPRWRAWFSAESWPTQARRDKLIVFRHPCEPARRRHGGFKCSPSSQVAAPATCRRCRSGLSGSRCRCRCDRGSESPPKGLSGTTPERPPPSLFPVSIIEVDVGWRLRKLRVSCTGEADGDGASAVKHDDILPWEERRITGIYADHRTASSGDS